MSTERRHDGFKLIMLPLIIVRKVIIATVSYQHGVLATA